MRTPKTITPTLTKDSEAADTTAADRYVLDNMRETTEMLVRMGKLSPIQIEEEQALRASVSAQPLRLDDARMFDASTVVTPEEYGPEAVRSLREREGASQAVFARHLNVATKTLGQWERGQRRPEGPAAKLLALVEAHGLSYISR